MCGILGVLRLTKGEPISLPILRNMADTIVHRGPDDEGFWHDERMGFGFRRLVIIDPETGQQPMTNEDGTIHLVCNGEIFNYRELRRELRAKGHRLRTQSDVEVLLHLYEEEGPDMLDRINGQFAFAIWDTVRQRLFLARDQFGVVPLFFTRLGHSLIFASEIKALLAYPGVQRRVDLTGLDQLLSLPGPVSPRTMFEGIESLPPGHFLLADDNGIRKQEYWDLTYPLEHQIDYSKPEEHHIEVLRERMIQSIRLRLQADVPVGSYLSGGLDSCTIVGMIARETPLEPQTFSIDFEAVGFSERKFQRLMSEHVGMPHLEIPFGGDEILQRLRKVVYHAEIPLKETYNTASHTLSEAVHDKGVRVVLNGEGADELFAGYVGYRTDAFRKDKPTSETPESLALQRKLWGDPPITYEKSQHAFMPQKRVLFSERLRAQHASFDFTNHQIIPPHKLASLHIQHKRSYLDMKLRLAHHLLADHGDRMTMAHSVEGRFPFLDVDLVKAVTAMPPDLMLARGRAKYPLGRVARAYVPEKIIKRRKYPFSAPGSPELIRQGHDWIEHILAPSTIASQGYFDPDTVARLTLKYRQPDFELNVPYEDDLLLVVITFGIFLETFDMPSL